MRIGILMGGRSREREISFAGGRTVFDNLDRSRFTPVPLLVDGRGSLVLIDWQFLYRGTLRDFFPPAELLGSPPLPVHIDQLDTLDDGAYFAALSRIGSPINVSELPWVCDAVFTTLHGAWGEDGSLQGMLQWLGLPFTGAGIGGSVLGIDKTAQRRWMQQAGFPVPKFTTVSRAEWLSKAPGLANRIAYETGFPCVLKHPTQGSSIGVAIASTERQLQESLDRAFLCRRIEPAAWQARSDADRMAEVIRIADLRYDVGLPLWLEMGGQRTGIHGPHELLHTLNAAKESVVLHAIDQPDEVLIEEYLPGDEFSVIVLETADGKPLALPPTRIHKSGPMYDYRGKYLAGAVSKETPMRSDSQTLNNILRMAERLQQEGNFGSCARLDGILGLDSVPYFNDPNTTSGMLPGSFIFHQAAEVGLSPTALLTYIIEQSLVHRLGSPTTKPRALVLQEQLNARHAELQAEAAKRQRVGVVLGGYSSEKHISVESGRNAFQKLASSDVYEPVPLFLLNNALLSAEQKELFGIGIDEPAFSLWEMPLSLLLKDNADDIAKQIVSSIGSLKEKPAAIAQQYERASSLRERYTQNPTEHPVYVPLAGLAEYVDLIFNTVHGRPGEDGQLAQIFIDLGLPHNGCSPEAARLTMDKAACNAALDQHGFRTARRRLIHKADWLKAGNEVLAGLTEDLDLPVVLKPNDEGCSSAVLKLESVEQMQDYLALTFRYINGWDAERAERLGISSEMDFPRKEEVLIEEWICKPLGGSLTEITIGFVTTYNEADEVEWQVFEPSETVAGAGVLSLEEKFLAGEGQNLTPARLSYKPDENETLTEWVREQTGAALQALQVESYGRVDAFVRTRAGGAPELIFIEINSLPGFTPATVLFHQAARSGLRPIDLMNKILTFGHLRELRTRPPLSPVS